MSEIKTFYAHCEYCKQETDNVHDVVPLGYASDIEAVQNGFECVDRAACKRRQKRDAVLADMQEMAKKPRRNRANDTLVGIVFACGAFLGGAAATALSWLFMVGF